MLCYDNQLSQPDLIVNVSEVLPLLNTSHELICRILVFLRFLEHADIKDEAIVQKVFHVHIHMLELPFEPCQHRVEPENGPPVDVTAGPVLPPESVEVVLTSMELPRGQIHEHDLLLYSEFRNFSSIARVYSHIFRINEKNRDLSSAFVAQCKLAALTAEIFNLKKQTIDGIPTMGSKAFPFIVNNVEVDLSAYPADSAYLVLQSELFTERALAQSLEHSMDLCQEVGLHWVTDDIAEILFNDLEKQRQFQAFKKVHESFVGLQKTESARPPRLRANCSQRCDRRAP
jgi:hypothetical protein